eukprot:TRINITY_DN3066_c0_g1_i4.p1 TRINITY_DN3066_c0_g1~~TRINITY_DN3066_c0_g1_i4.p1  ORF type:complete len:674 (-),score=309.55 TRINITY_DN3066_c0_g1_i4:852-2873(-)
MRRGAQAREPAAAAGRSVSSSGSVRQQAPSAAFAAAAQRGVSTGADAAVGGLSGKALDAVLRSAQQTGVLTLQGRELRQVPAQAFRLDEITITVASAAAGDPEANKWWEREPLKKLDLCHNLLRDLPADIARAAETLRVVLLSHNELASFPTALLALSQLSRLDLSHNAIRELSDGRGEAVSFGRLTALVELSLANNQLQAALPSSIGQLSMLDKLDLSNNRLTSLPLELNRIAGLKHFSAAHNQLQALPDALFDSWQLLVELDLSDNRLGSCPPLASLGSVTRVDLRQNALRQPPLTGGALESLKELYLGCNQLQRMAPSSAAAAFFADLPRLALLDVHTNNIAEVPVEIVGLTALNSLDLRNNDLSSLPPELATIASLKKLYVEGNMLKTIPTALVEKGAKAILEHLKKKLTAASGERGAAERVQDYLDADDASAAPWKSLVNEARASGVLQLSERKLAEIPAIFWQLEGLTKIVAARNALVGGAGSFSGVSRLENLTSVIVPFNKIDCLPPELVRCVSLVELDVSNNLLKEVPQWLGELQELHTLSLSCNRLSQLPNELFKAPRLQRLIVSFNQLTQIPLGIQHGSSLRHLDFSENKITTIPAKELCALANLNVLLLSNNNISQVPGELGLCTQLQTLTLQGNALRAIRPQLLEKPTAAFLEYLRGRIVP